MNTTRTTSPLTWSGRLPGPGAAVLLGLALLALPACSKSSPPAVPADAAPTTTASQAEDEGAAEGRRRQSVANLRRISQAVSDYAVECRHLLPAALCDRKTGQPLLSWRVALLPYIGEEALYKEFNLGEPWDGPANKKLLEKMPPVYAVPGTSPGTRGMTHYRGFEAVPGSRVRTAWATLPARESPFGAWGGGFPHPVTDGTSNTLAVVEAAEAVPWTRPGELPYDPMGPLPRLGGLFKDGFHAGMLDGSAHFFSNLIKEADLRGLITADGGEVVDIGKLMEKGLIRVGGRRPDSD